uniref:Myosin motor domain-containing protein n=1 Tax=Arcella intermedia TaxID=1963864 RepID=A0A6B2KXX5_9EUKA
MTKLEQLHESIIIHNIRQRFFKEKIYTFIGPVIVSVNPYKVISELGSHLIPLYQEAPKSEASTLPPHLYAVAQRAYDNMISLDKSQSIIIIGESGAGKTEATKIVLNYLTKASERSEDSSLDIAEMILATNPLLEAFGNAKTVRNDNSSRFGKFIKVLFDGSRIIGASIDNYLLEKTRVVGQAEKERNYHIFYQIINGMTEEEKKKYEILNSEEQYQYLRYGKVPVPKDDALDWNLTKKAFSTLGFTPSELDTIYTILSAILWLGNIDFVTAARDEVSIKDSLPLEKFCQLLGINVISGVVRKALLSRSVQAKGRKSISYVPYSYSQAIANRDALAKRLYSELFNWLVKKLNTQLKQHGDHPDTKFIGVLDIYGFEIFEKNSLEQFCINYANEKLHTLFTNEMFKSEQEEYTSDGVEWRQVDFKDNSGCISLIEKQRGIIDVIQEQCKMGDACNDDTLMASVKRIASPWMEQSRPNEPQNQFKVKHFAGTVSYSAEDFVEKNRDTLNTDMENFMRKCTDALISSFFESEPEPPKESLSLSAQEKYPDALVSPRRSGFFGSRTPGPGSETSTPRNSGYLSRSSTPTPQSAQKIVVKDKKTLSLRFKEDLGKLVDTLNSSGRHYVRCIKPNELKSSKEFHSKKVMEQLTCNGVFETVKIRKAGFSTRLLMETFFSKYWALLKSKDRDSVEALLNELMPNKTEWCLGKTKVFLRDSALSVLDAKLTLIWKNQVIPIQKHIRAYTAQTKYLHMLATRLTQSYIRRRMAIMKLDALVELNDAAIVFQKYIHQKMASDELATLKYIHQQRVKAATVIQRYTRSAFAQRKLDDLKRRLELRKKRASTYGTYYEFTVVNPTATAVLTPSIPINVDSDTDPVYVVVVNK